MNTAELLARNKALRKALEAIQWDAELGHWEEGGCKQCGAHNEKEGHGPDCIVGKALAMKHE